MLPKDNHKDNLENEVMEQLQALGYIDPGAGSLMLQLILGGVFKISRTVKLFFRELFGFFRSSEPKKK